MNYTTAVARLYSLTWARLSVLCGKNGFHVAPCCCSPLVARENWCVVDSALKETVNATNSMLRLNARTKRDVHVPRSICRCPYVFGRPLLFLFLLASPWLYDVDTCMRTSIDKCTAVDEHVAVRKSGRRLCCVRLRYPCCSATSTPPCVLSVPPSRPVFSARSTLRLPSRFVPYGMW